MLNKKANQKELENHWSKLYDEYWTLKNNSLAKLMLRKENEKLVLRSKLSILYTIHNTILSLSNIPITEKSTQQKFELIRLYEKQTKNKLSLFSNFIEIIDKVKASINNFENQLQKLVEETNTKAEKSIINSFDIIVGVSVALQIPLNVDTISVAEFLSYEKLAVKKSKANEQK